MNICFFFPAPSPPRNLQLHVVSSTSIEASWDEPETKNGNIRRYAVSYGKDRLDTQLYTTETKYLLTSLDENTLYSVQVTAETSVSGNPSGTKQVKTFEDGETLLSMAGQILWIFKTSLTVCLNLTDVV